MSLILRKECQTVLNEFNFDDYHVRINEDTKYLTIVGPCGKPLFTISGIKFSRMQPTTIEIDYAVTLLTDFFHSHKKKIETYFKARAAYNKVKEPKIPSGYRLINTRINFKDEVGGSLDYYFQTQTWEFEQNQPTTLSVIGALARNKNITQNMIVYGKAKVIFNTAQKAFNDAKAAVQTCDI